ncbi:hypothetical protein BGW39_004177 [Mortierella sp. 14UC]|nr:hypothetical protein BGW39_004177 [Mortierella sp. 14UC]
MAASVTKHQDVALVVKCPLLSDYSSSTITSQVCAGNSIWAVTLTLQAPALIVSVVWNRQDYQDLTGYKTMFIIPHCAPNKSIHRALVNSGYLSAGRVITIAIDAEKVTDQGKYAFGVVLSSSSDKDKDLLYSYSLKKDNMTASPTRTNSNHIVLKLLRDPASVDVVFMFETDKAFDGVDLWAHSAILSEYKVFEELIRQGKEIRSETIRAFNSDEQGEREDVRKVTAKPDSDPT